jgi:hypothetical protein
MKASELRIWNLVNYETERESVTMEITYEYIRLIHNGANKFKPIPLTEEWLLKLGFKNDGTKEDNEFYSKEILGDNKSTYKIFIRINDGISDCLISEKISYSESEHVIVPKFVKHVHQLQNLYFALTNEELTLTK